MHMADALVSPAVAGSMYALSAAAVGYSIRQLRREDDTRKIPVMGVMGAFVFAAQMINFTIPGTGASGHICGGMLLTALLGPYAALVTMTCILLIQCLLFADGGLLALGCNIWNMASYGCLIGALIWRLVCRGGFSRKKITAASILGCVLSLQLGAFSVTIETLLSGITELPFTTFAAFMQPIHLIIGLVEGLITGAVLCFIYDARPELLWKGNYVGGAAAAEASAGETNGRDSSEEAAGKGWSRGRVLGVLAGFSVLMAGVLSIFASALPDGLEWAIGKTSSQTEVTAAGQVYSLFSGIVDKLALLREYSLPGSGSAAGGAAAGIIGTLIVAAICIGVCTLLKSLGRRQGESEV